MSGGGTNQAGAAIDQRGAMFEVTDAARAAAFPMRNMRPAETIDQGRSTREEPQ